jgi:two-component system response regulator PilR (NtrC family)
MSEKLKALSILPGDVGPKRVLVVDDDVVQRMMLVRILKKAGYDSASAMSNEEARSLLDNSAYGLVVADLHMFAEDGIELIRHVADHHRDTVSIVVSGFASEKDIDRLHRAGAFELMTKPIDATKFLDLVGRAFEARALRREQVRHRSG